MKMRMVVRRKMMRMGTMKVMKNKKEEEGKQG